MYKALKNIIPVTSIKNLKPDGIIVPFLQKAFHSVFSFPKVVQMHITSDCNLNCTYCYSKHETKHMINWYKVLSEAKQLGAKNIEFLGGEPFVDPHFKKYLSFCSEHSLGIKIYTNGTLLTDTWITFLNSLSEKPMLVFKYDDLDSYEQFTAKGVYDIVKKNIVKCVKAGIDVHGHMVINAKNYFKLKEIIKSTKTLGILLTIERYMPVGSSLDNELSLDIQKWNETLSILNEYYGGINSNYVTSSVIKGNTCSCYIDLLSIDVEGFVKPCPFSDKSQIFGDVKTESLETIWKRFIQLRKKWMIIPNDCKDCKYKYLCHGGCKTMTYKEKRTYNAKDPLCNGSFIPTSIYSDEYLK